MLPPTSESARGTGPGAAIAATTKKQDPQQDSGTTAAVVEFGTEHQPSGNQYPRVTVRCSRCGRTHFHVKFEAGATSIVRSPACARHTEYRVEIVDVVPAAHERRHRGAA